MSDEAARRIDANTIARLAQQRVRIIQNDLSHSGRLCNARAAFFRRRVFSGGDTNRALGLQTPVRKRVGESDPGALRAARKNLGARPYEVALRLRVPE